MEEEEEEEEEEKAQARSIPTANFPKAHSAITSVTTAWRMTFPF